MRLLSLNVEELRRLDQISGGSIYKAIQDVVRQGSEPELVVRRHKGDVGELSRWFVRVVPATPEHEIEIHDVRAVAVAASIWLADMREELAGELRRRVERHREQS